MQHHQSWPGRAVQDTIVAVPDGRGGESSFMSHQTHGATKHRTDTKATCETSAPSLPLHAATSTCAHAVMLSAFEHIAVDLHDVGIMTGQV